MGQQQHTERLGCMSALIQPVMRFILRLFGIGTRGVRDTLKPLDQHYREFVDTWVS